MRRPLIIASVVVAVIFVASAAAYVQSKRETALPIFGGLGKPGAIHSHASMLVFVNNELVDLSGRKYMEKDEHVHFHDGSGTVIHKHARGVTLPFLFETLGMKLAADCFTSDTGEEFCGNGTSKLSIFVNGKEVGGQVNSHEIENNDKILINYGSDDKIDLGIKLNLIPDLPPDLILK